MCQATPPPTGWQPAKSTVRRLLTVSALQHRLQQQAAGGLIHALQLLPARRRRQARCQPLLQQRCGVAGARQLLKPHLLLSLSLSFGVTLAAAL